MASLPSKPKPTTRRTLRYNAKTSLSTRYADDWTKSDYLLRTVTGILAPDVSWVQSSIRAGLKPARKLARQKNTDYVNEPEAEASKGSNKLRTQISTPQSKPSAPNIQLAYELELAFPHPMPSELQPQATLFISACSLLCKRLSLTPTASASLQTPASITTVPMKHSAARAPLKCKLHWHIHTHSGEQNSHGPARHSNSISDNNSPCIDLQILEGALARMYDKKPWPADMIVLEEFYGINGRYEYEVVGDCLMS